MSLEAVCCSSFQSKGIVALVELFLNGEIFSLLCYRVKSALARTCQRLGQSFCSFQSTDVGLLGAGVLSWEEFGLGLDFSDGVKVQYSGNNQLRAHCDCETQITSTSPGNRCIIHIRMSLGDYHQIRIQDFHSCERKQVRDNVVEACNSHIGLNCLWPRGWCLRISPRNIPSYLPKQVPLFVSTLSVGVLKIAFFMGTCFPMCVMVGNWPTTDPQSSCLLTQWLFFQYSSRGSS